MLYIGWWPINSTHTDTRTEFHWIVIFSKKIFFFQNLFWFVYSLYYLIRNFQQTFMNLGLHTLSKLRTYTFVFLSYNYVRLYVPRTCLTWLILCYVCKRMLLNKISKNGMFVNQYQYLLSWKLLQYCDKQTEQTKNLDNTEHQIKILNSI